LLVWQLETGRKERGRRFILLFDIVIFGLDNIESRVLRIIQRRIYISELRSLTGKFANLQGFASYEKNYAG